MMSTAIDRHDALPVAPRAGADLRAARERVGWTLQDMAAALRIRLPYLEALEAGRLDELPGNAYALGFLRTYASALGLDPDEIARRFKAEASTVNQKTELTFPVPVPARGVPAGAVVLLGVVLAVGAYAGWYRLSGEGRLPAETNTAGADASGSPGRAGGAADQPAADHPTAAGPAGCVDACRHRAGPAGRCGTAGSGNLAQFGRGSAVAGAARRRSQPPDQSRILLRASADAWVQVRDRAGPVLLNRILHPGETWAVPPKPNLVLTTGNAGGTDLLVDGVATAVLGQQRRGAARSAAGSRPDQGRQAGGRTAGGRSAAGRDAAA